MGAINPDSALSAAFHATGKDKRYPVIKYISLEEIMKSTTQRECNQGLRPLGFAAVTPLLDVWNKPAIIGD